MLVDMARLSNAGRSACSERLGYARLKHGDAAVKKD